MSLVVPLRVVRDISGGEAEWQKARLILVRPDQYIVCAGDELPARPEDKRHGGR